MNHQAEVSGSRVVTLFYDEIRGSIQPIRNLLNYLQVPFEERSEQGHKPSEGQFNCGYPRLEHEGILIHDTIPIFRYLCRYHNHEILLGLTPHHRTSINQFLFKFSEIRSKIFKKFSQAARLIWAKKQQCYEIKSATFKSIMDEECRILKSLLLIFIVEKKWLMGYLTIADFFFYEICFYLTNFFKTVIEKHEMYANIFMYQEMFEKETAGKNSKNIIKKKIFPPFKDQRTLEIIKNVWEGDAEILA